MLRKRSIVLISAALMLLAANCAETSSHRRHLMRARQTEAFAKKQEQAAKQNLEKVNNVRASMENVVLQLKAQEEASGKCLKQCERKLRRLGVRIPKAKK